MKKSKYNHISNHRGYTVLYNIATDSVCQLDTQLAELYGRHSADEIYEIHPDFYEFLESNKFILPNDADEVQNVIEQWKLEDATSDTFTIAINPTLNCNLHCWYCYENHSGNLMMSTDIYNKILSYISNVMTQRSQKHIHLGFFGGEPLLNFNNIARPLIQESYHLSKLHGKTISYSFVTNGTLADEKFADFIRELNVPVSLQITFDGNRDSHNLVRNTNQQNGGTYDLILENCARLLRNQNVTLVIRCNYTHSNILSFIDLAAQLEDTIQNHVGALHVELHQVWQDMSSSSHNILAHEEVVRNAFRKIGISVSAPKRISKYRCYADTGNSILINYNGDVFRCTARDFASEHREGTLGKDGSITMNSRSQMRDSIRWGNDTCKACAIYPICHGGCSQNKLEHADVSGCLYNYDTDIIHRIIEDRLSLLLSSVN
ncbi:MAG: radical SAM protein [Bacteroides sp.]|nr:radical SAM protein [Bacteroides sp.]